MIVTSLMVTPAQQSSPSIVLPMLAKKTDLIHFYNELSSLVRSIPKHNVLVIGRDMNAQIGKNVNNKFKTRQIEIGNI